MAAMRVQVPGSVVAAVESHFSFHSAHGTSNMLGGGCTGHGRGRQLFLRSHDIGSLCTEWKGVWEPLDSLLFKLKGAMSMKQPHKSIATTSAAPVTRRHAGLQLLIGVNLQAQGDLQATMAYLVIAVKGCAFGQVATQQVNGNVVVMMSRSVAGNASGSMVGIALHEHGLLYERMWDPGGRGL